MRILLVSHTYPPYGIGGVERVTQWSAIGLSKSGHSVTVLTRRMTATPPLPTIERCEQDGIDVIRISGGAGGSSGLQRRRLESIFERTLLELMPDVVVLGHLMNHSPGYVSIAKRWQIPVVLELHDFYVACERAHLEQLSGSRCEGPNGGKACAEHCIEGHNVLTRSTLRTHIFRRALAEADVVLAPSRFVADYFAQGYRTRAPIRVLPNGIVCHGAVAPVVRRDCVDAPLHLASLGAVAPHKGIHVVIEALGKARLANVCYTLFGPTSQPYVSELRMRARRIPGLCFRTFGGYEPHQLPTLLGGVDAVLIPSVVWETFSIVAREAMACGVPVIASRLGAMIDAVREGENGWLFTDGASSELASLLQRLDSDRSLLERARKRARASEWISVEERTRQLEQLLEGISATPVDRPLADEHMELNLLHTSIVNA